jgi:hypothetical protein
VSTAGSIWRGISPDQCGSSSPGQQSGVIAHDGAS